MPEKTKWEVDQLKLADSEMNTRLNNHAKRIRSLESFKDSTIEKLVQIFDVLEDIKESSKWMKRTFTGTLISGIAGAVISIIIWAIQN